MYVTNYCINHSFPTQIFRFFKYATWKQIVFISIIKPSFTGQRPAGN